MKTKCTRTYQLLIKSTQLKGSTARYSHARFHSMLNLFCGKLFFSKNKSVSTAGLGLLANQAQHKARGVVSGVIALQKLGLKTNAPVVKNTGCPARIRLATKGSFDYWVDVENLWTRADRVYMPCNSHKKLKSALRNGWKLNPTCEVVIIKDKFYARVYAQKEVEKPSPSRCLGVDVGMVHSVSRSDGYLGKSASKILKKTSLRNAERHRQGHRRKVFKSSFRQRLDIEANRAVKVSLDRGLSLAVESPKVLARLMPKLQWARAYFANRVRVVAKENGVFVWDVNPYASSQTCFKCGHCDKESRLKLVFNCTACGNRTHADINAARVIGQRGEASLEKYFLKNQGSLACRGVLKSS